MILNKEDIEKEVRLLKNTIFIYPTDTIYGIGCNAEDVNLVKKIRNIKERQDQPFSVIVPGKEWILRNCDIEKNNENLNKLPGPYTLILRLKNKKAIAENVSFSDTLGVRIPDHWISKVVEDLGFPIVTTSVNVHGSPFMTSLEDLDQKIKESVNFIIYENKINGRPSTIIDLTKDKTEIKVR